MKKALDLQNDKISKLFFSYLVPAISAGVVMSLYILVDGIFVGKGIGSQGLAAVGLVVPMFTIFNGLSMIFGIGGSTHAAIMSARGNRAEANRYFSLSVYSITAVMLLLTLIVFVFKEQILISFGASGDLLELSKSYLSIMIIFSLFQALAFVFSMFVRIEGFPKIALISTLVGAGLNIILDYAFIFIFKLGVTGAGLATGTGNIVATLIMLHFFITKKGKLRFVKPNITIEKLKNVFSIGIPSFLSQGFISLITVLYNLRLLDLAGEKGVSAFSSIGYLLPLMMMVFLGVTQAVQPIISANYATLKHDRMRETLRLGIKTSLIIGGIFAIVGILFNNWIIGLFISSNDSAYEIATNGLPFYFTSYIFIGLTLVYSTYFQSIEKPKYALYLSVLRGAVLILPLMYLLSSIFGVVGMWYGMILAEILTSLIAITFRNVYKLDENVKLSNNLAA